MTADTNYYQQYLDWNDRLDRATAARDAAARTVARAVVAAESDKLILSLAAEFAAADELHAEISAERTSK